MCKTLVVIYIGALHHLINCLHLVICWLVTISFKGHSKNKLSWFQL